MVWQEKKSPHECISTEMLKRAICDINQTKPKLNIEKKFISMDVESLNTSIKIDLGTGKI